jgi:hypothetical protein
MRPLPSLLLGLAVAAAALAQDNAEAKATRRYGVDLSLRRYPQNTPQEALKSVLKTLESGKVFYLAAQLADPRYIDDRVREHKRRLGNKGSEADRDLVAFDRVVQDISSHLRDDPSLTRDLRRLGREGQWEVADDKASARLKGVGRRALFRKVGDRWFLQNEQD